MAWADQCIYPADCRKPEPTIGALFAKHELPDEFRIALCQRKFGQAEIWAALGSDATKALETLKKICPDLKWPGEEQASDLALLQIQIQAVWSSATAICKANAEKLARIEEDPLKLPAIPDHERQIMRAKWSTDHPDLPLTEHSEPHPRFVDRIQRDVKLRGRVPYYKIIELRLVADKISETSGWKKNVNDLIEATKLEDTATIDSESNAIDRIKSFYVALAFLQILEASSSTSLLFIKYLEQFHRRHQGLDHILKVYHIFHKAIDDYTSDHPAIAFKDAFTYILKHGDWVWNTAITQVAVDRMSTLESRSKGQNGGSRGGRVEPPPSPHPATPLTGRGRDRKRKQAQRAQGSQNGEQPSAASPMKKIQTPAPKGTSKGGKDQQKSTKRISPDEWAGIKNAQSQCSLEGIKPCDFFQSSIGCLKGASCKYRHICCICGSPDHGWSKHR